MALSSMTGFARSHGGSGPYTFEWELKSVNAKGFDLRLRLPQGWDELEAHAKKRAGELLARGTVYANFNLKRANALSTVRINEDVLASVVKVAHQLAGKIDAVAPSIDGLLTIKVLIESVEPESNEERTRPRKPRRLPPSTKRCKTWWRCAGAKAQHSARSFPSAWTKSRRWRKRRRPRPAARWRPFARGWPNRLRRCSKPRIASMPTG